MKKLFHIFIPKFNTLRKSSVLTPSKKRFEKHNSHLSRAKKFKYLLALSVCLRICWLYPLQKGKTLPQKKKKYMSYDTKQHLMVNLQFWKSRQWEIPIHWHFGVLVLLCKKYVKKKKILMQKKKKKKKNEQKILQSLFLFFFCTWSYWIQIIF